MSRNMLDNYKEEKARAAVNFKTNKAIPLINELDYSEYWNYLSRY